MFVKSYDSFNMSALPPPDLEGNSYQNNQLLKMILTMHQFIISSADMLQKLSDLYPLQYSPAHKIKIRYA